MGWAGGARGRDGDESHERAKVGRRVGKTTRPLCASRGLLDFMYIGSGSGFGCSSVCAVPVESSWDGSWDEDPRGWFDMRGPIFGCSAQTAQLGADKEAQAEIAQAVVGQDRQWDPGRARFVGGANPPFHDFTPPQQRRLLLRTHPQLQNLQPHIQIRDSTTQLSLLCGRSLRDLLRPHSSKTTQLKIFRISETKARVHGDYFNTEHALSLASARSPTRPQPCHCLPTSRPNTARLRDPRTLSPTECVADRPVAAIRVVCCRSKTWQPNSFMH